MAQQAAKKIYANNGQGVLFVLDGWDELPYLSVTKISFHFLSVDPARTITEKAPT